MKLNEAERSSAVWQKVSAELERQLQVYREKNDAQDRTHEETCFLRGQIKAIKDVLDMAKPMPAIQG